jgi:exosortase D (VPLPA-CTERM-specific)
MLGRLDFRESLRMRSGPVGYRGIAWLTIAIFGALPVFWFGLEKLVEEWQRPEFRLKPIVPFVSFLLFLQVLRSVPLNAESDRTRWLGVPVLAGALLLAIVGNLIDVDDFIFVALIPWMAGLILVTFGLARGLQFWAPVASLFLMLPLPHFIVDPIQHHLRALASDLATDLLRILGVPALVDGQILEFGVFELRVSEATTGLSNFLPLLLVFCIFATFYRGPLWSRVVPLVLAAPTLLLLSSLRIVLLGVAINRFGADVAETLLSWMGDWVLLLASACLLLGIVLGAERLVGRDGTHSRIDLDFGDMLSQLARALVFRPTPQLIAAALTSLALSAIFVGNPIYQTERVERQPFSMFPPEVAGWSGSSAEIRVDTAQVLDADDYVLIDYYHPSEAAPVNFWSAYYYKTGANKAQIHSPQECLPGDDWNILSLRPVELPMGLRGQSEMTVNRAVISKGSQKALVYYWFEGRGRTMANERVAKLMAKLDGLTKGRTDGALLRFTTLILAGEDEGTADARIIRLLEPMLDQLPRFFPN